MRRSLQPLAVLLVAVLIIVVLAIASAGSPSDDSNPSSRSAGKLGTLALYTWLGGLGLDVTRMSGDFSLGNSDVLIEYDASIDFTSSEMQSIDSFLRNGGLMIVAWDAGSLGVTSALLQHWQVQLAGTEGTGTAVPAQPFDPSGRVAQVPVGPGFAMVPQPPLAPLLQENGQTVAAGEAMGSGRLFLLGNSLPLSNDGLRHDDSSYFALSLLGRARGGRIAFDEFHHGEGGASGGASAIFGGPVGLAAVLAALLCIAVLAINGRRIGRAAAAGDTTSVPSTTAYVSAVGDLFARSRRRGLIAARYADELKHRISDATGISANLDDGEFVAAIRAADAPEADEVAAMLDRARSLADGNPDERALLQLAREIDSAERAWSPDAQLRP